MITVTKPYLPPLDEFTPYLEEIWKNSQLTNNGPFHQQFEGELARYLGVEYLSLFANGTLALLTALQALKIKGDVITTPYSFVATSHSLWWNNIKPVFVDIEPQFCNLDPAKIEAAITTQTTAIMPVHVYGNPCDVQAIQAIADRHNLKVIYDACHTFNVRIHGVPVVKYGNLSVMSFHATKVFNTFEGGAIISHTPEMKQRIDHLKNFGFNGETTVVGPGINAKMNEVQCAMGLLQLKHIDDNIKKRRQLADRYREMLSEIPGLWVLKDMPGVQHCYNYFPVFIDENHYGISRDALYEKLKQHNIFGRRYFYPLISQFPTYNELDSAMPGKLPVAESITQKVICLPMYPELEPEQQNTIIKIIDN